jgi:hypothetical protein
MVKNPSRYTREMAWMSRKYSDEMSLLQDVEAGSVDSVERVGLMSGARHLTKERAFWSSLMPK